MHQTIGSQFHTLCNGNKNGKNEHQKPHVNLKSNQHWNPKLNGNHSWWVKRENQDGWSVRYSLKS